jgi:hypothetical protein
MKIKGARSSFFSMGFMNESRLRCPRETHRITLRSMIDDYGIETWLNFARHEKPYYEKQNGRAP